VPFAITADPLDPEQARYAPRAPRRFVWVKRVCVLAVLAGLVWSGLALVWSWSQDQYYVGEDDGAVVIFRGVNTELLGFSLSEPYERTDVQVDRLSEIEADRVREGIASDDLAEAEAKVRDLAARQDTSESTGSGG
jgi:PPM family protein phosphatase